MGGLHVLNNMLNEYFFLKQQKTILLPNPNNSTKQYKNHRPKLEHLPEQLGGKTTTEQH